MTPAATSSSRSKDDLDDDFKEGAAGSAVATSAATSRTSRSRATKSNSKARRAEELEEAKEQLRKMASSTAIGGGGSQRTMRRTLSQEQAGLAGSSEQGATPPRGAAAAAEEGHSHPVAPAGGVPMPTLRDLAPPARRRPSSVERRSGVTVTYNEASEPVVRQQEADQEDEAAEQAVPDYAPGHGGDGIGGHGLPITATGPLLSRAQTPVSNDDDAATTDLELIARIMPLLQCRACPEDDRRRLSQPVTLRCGHTVSSAHLQLPHLPTPSFSSSESASAECHAAMAAYNLKRLALWMHVQCPIENCITAHTIPSAPGHSRPSSSGSGMSGTSAAEIVNIFPSPTLSSSARMSAADEDDAGHGHGHAGVAPHSTIVDVSVAKILGAIDRRQALAAQQQQHQSRRQDDEDRPRTPVSSDGSDADAEEDEPASPRRRPSKRRRGQYPPGNAGAALAAAVASQSLGKELLGILECDVCACLLHEPVTTPCQHTFCGKCLARSLDHSSKCPLCRQDLPPFAFFHGHATNQVIQSILLTGFPQESTERREAIERDERDSRLDTPLFICTLAFPGMPTILHVFEPRYRLMLRRCVESGTPRFGMLLPARGTGNPSLQGVMEYGTMLDIKSIQMLPDGRSMVETVGSYRFRLLEKGSLDGYTVGRVERIDDIDDEDEAELERLSIARARQAKQEQQRQAQQTAADDAIARRPSPQRTQSAFDVSQSSSQESPAAGSSSSAAVGAQTAAAPVEPLSPEQLPDIEPSTTELMAICVSFIDQLRSGSAPWLLQRLNNTYGPMPDTPSEFSYWMALVMPIDEYEKARLLPIRSPRLRLRLIVHWVEQLRSSWWFSSG